MDSLLFRTILDRLVIKAKENNIESIDLNYAIDKLYEIENSIDTCIANHLQ